MVVNEFIKSIARTLGRIAAYILLGILAYFIFTWFDSEQVKAESINNTTNNNNYYFQSINSSWSWNSNGWGQTFTDTSNNIIGFDATPYNNGYIVPSSSDYSITIDYRLLSRQNTTMYQPNLLIEFSTDNTNYISSSCDGNSSNSVLDNGVITIGNVTYLYLNLRYSCTNLNINQTFSSMRFRVYNSSSRYVQLKINSYTFADLRDLNSDTQSIINNNNQNTQNIINNMIDRANDLLHSESQTQQAVYDNTQAVETMDAHMTSESPPNINILSGVQEMMPSNTPITDIITLPLNILNKEIQSLGGSCQAWTINTGSLLGNNTWTFPCLNIGQYFTSYSYSGYNLWQLIDLMICLFMGYKILMLIINSYNKIANLDDTFNQLYTTKG